MEFSVFIGFLESSTMRLCMYAFLQISNSSVSNKVETISYFSAFVVAMFLCYVPYMNYISSKNFDHISKKKLRKYGILMTLFHK
jgi:hypothetical protein